MVSSQNFVDYVVEQLENAGTVSPKEMFGEYAIYCDKKVMALVCGNQLFVKNETSRAFIDDVKGVPSYPGVKMSSFNRG